MQLEWAAGGMAVAALAAAGAWLFRRRVAIGGTVADTPASRAERAAQLGWIYEDGSGTGFVLKGEDAGIEWRARFRAGGGDSGRPPVLTWATRSVQGAATELRFIGRLRYERGRANVEPATEKSSSLILAAREVSAAQARAAFLERTPPVGVGSPGFRTRFTVVARNHRLASALFDAVTEDLITRWPRIGGRAAEPEASLSIWLDWQGLRVDLEGPFTSMAEIEHLVKLGMTLAHRYRRHAANPGVTRFMETQPGAA